MDAERLLGKIASGKPLEVAETDQLAEVLDVLRFDEELRSRVSIDDEYSMLLCLRHADLSRYIGVFAFYLGCNDPQTVCLVLKTLCEDAGRRDDYLERLFDYALGTSWDYDHDVQCFAVSQLGEYVREALAASSKKGGGSRDKVVGLQSGEDDGLLKQSVNLLVSQFYDSTLPYEVRFASYRALQRAQGVDEDDMPSPYARVSLEMGSTDVDWNVLQWATSSSLLDNA